MKTVGSRGFTLIELLTVIAIISILAALTAVTLPRVLERAKITDVESDFNALRTALATFATDHGTFPPGQDFVTRTPDGDTPNLLHYFTLLNLTKVEALYDRFSQEQVAYVYIPVNSKQFDRVKRYYDSRKDYFAKGTLDDPQLSLTAPVNYDAYVLLSVGPGGKADLGGVFPDPLPDELFDFTGATPANPLGANINPLGANKRALRAYYLATRDVNDNSLLDFDFRARTRQGEGKLDAYPDPPFDATQRVLLYHLPNEINDAGTDSTTGTATLGGPMIFKQGP